MMRLISDASEMSKLSHPNILTFHATCLDEGSLAIISEYMANGNLKDRLADPNTPLPLPKRIRIAYEIAKGMAFIDGLRNEDMRKHDSLKSNNILIGRDWEIKIADYGQSNIKDLARTMTSIGSVAWTGTFPASIEIIS